MSEEFRSQGWGSFISISLPIRTKACFSQAAEDGNSGLPLKLAGSGPDRRLSCRYSVLKLAGRGPTVPFRFRSFNASKFNDVAFSQLKDMFPLTRLRDSARFARFPLHASRLKSPRGQATLENTALKVVSWCNEPSWEQLIARPVRPKVATATEAEESCNVPLRSGLL